MPRKTPTKKRKATPADDDDDPRYRGEASTSAAVAADDRVGPATPEHEASTSAADADVGPERTLYACDYEGCDKVYKTPNGLRVHKRGKHEGVMHECTEPGCNAKFAQVGDLKRHVKTHRGEVARPHACQHPGCDAAFEYPSLLEAHVTAIHLGLKPHVCNYEGCNAAYAQKGKLDRHKKKEGHN